jgi:hypothetical protein
MTMMLLCVGHMTMHGQVTDVQMFSRILSDEVSHYLHTLRLLYCAQAYVAI